MIPSHRTPLTAGQTGFYLKCEISGTEDIGQHTIAYKWIKDGSMITDGGMGQTLSLSPLNFSHAGKYTCHIIVRPSSLQNEIFLQSINHWDVNLKSELNYST